MTEAPEPHFRDQYNVYVGQLLTTPPTPARKVAEHQLRSLQRRFTRPQGINDAYDTLAEHRIVFLDGTPGNGRTTAARVLLRELPRGAGTYHEIDTTEVGRANEVLSPDLVGEGDRMLLDLSASGEAVWKQHHDRLLGFYKVLLDQQAHLAVVLPHAYQLSPDFTEYRRTVSRPDGLRVIASHLRAHGVDTRDREPPPPALGEYLAVHPPMRELARLADLMLEARETLQRGGSFAEWYELAIAAQATRSHEVDSFVPALRKGSQRALLLTVAMLHGAPVDAVHHAAAKLQQQLGIPPDDRPLLEHKGLAERLRKVAATRDALSCAHFEQLRYDDAVRRHFWLNMPDLREPLRHWVDEVLTLPQLRPVDHERLVERFAELFRATDGLAGLMPIASEWAERDDKRSAYQRAAAELLSWGVRNEDTGSTFRAEIYRWSVSPMGDGLRRVLVEVCAQVMAVQYPEQAVVRLHQLGRREPDGRRRARDALLGFVAQDVHLQRHLLFRLAVHPPAKPEYREFDARLFLDLLALPTRPPHAFLRGAVTRDWLTVCWTAVFRHTDSTIRPARLQRWIAEVDRAEDPTLLPHALNVLIDAAADDHPALSQVYATARRSLSAEQTSLLLARIHEVQRAGLSRRTKPQEESPS
ncbi:hypothetical protein AB0I00_34780 [Streptomyces sp. NPDC050803]|uniref:hypothetical protein n=1 Tax=unclassified Streptomyces TaxID=2593676 RepID=UPI00342FED56